MTIWSLFLGKKDVCSPSLVADDTILDRMKKSAVNSAYLRDLHFCSVAITVTTAELHTLFFSCGCNVLLFICCQAYYDVLADATVQWDFCECSISMLLQN